MELGLQGRPSHASFAFSANQPLTTSGIQRWQGTGGVCGYDARGRVGEERTQVPEGGCSRHLLFPMVPPGTSCSGALQGSTCLQGGFPVLKFLWEMLVEVVYNRAASLDSAELSLCRLAVGTVTGSESTWHFYQPCHA